MPRQAQRFDGRTGITSSSRSAMERLPSYKRTYVKARAEGKTIRQASAEAGVSNTTGGKYEKNADIQQAYRELMQKAVPAKKLVKLIAGGCEAKMPVYNAQGEKVSERADWRTRKPYIDMAAKHAGYHEEKNAGGGVAITFVVNHIGQSKQAPTIDASRNQITAEAV